ncbi:hypothetical protein PNA2_1696 [Pyrococcus sp. NA2]|uniref:hypothetical protein n=1 Tax=Pyrococcus sp. (strain NA2) TaxID=342949 RepID=UPI000209AAB1|nr:hypothetical protein [Pyrococcus sp. NA2]AEC52611.1 hypothetical protein PNA2_1696 [Pyrococcus sp. NA2]
MPRGMGRGYGRGYRRFPAWSLIDLVFILIILYLLLKLFLVAAPYVIALVIVYLIWKFIRYPRPWAPWP